MKVTVAIPTVSSERWPLLVGAVRSLQEQTYKDIHIVIIVDGRPKLYELVNHQFSASPDVSVILNKEHSYWVASINRVLKEFDSDYYVYGADDIVFPPSCIASAVAIMKKRFPDGFGLINLFKKTKVLFGLFGRKWVEAYPERQVLCPDFIQYGADREITEVATKLGVCAPPMERENSVRHHSRNYGETWQLAEKIKEKDPETRRLRRGKGYKWGIDFNLIRK